MKITKSDDYSLLALDLFNFRKKNQKHFKVTMPTIIHFSKINQYLFEHFIPLTKSAICYLKVVRVAFSSPITYGLEIISCRVYSTLLTVDA